MRNGIITNKIVGDLKELRPYAVEEKNPLLAKVIRLTAEHIETYNTFDIPIPKDEPIEEDDLEEDELEGDELEGNELEEELEEEGEGMEEEAMEEEEETDPKESLDYLLSLMTDSQNKINALELREYSNNLIAYAEEN